MAFDSFVILGYRRVPHVLVEITSTKRAARLIRSHNLCNCRSVENSSQVVSLFYGRSCAPIDLWSITACPSVTMADVR